MTAKWPRQLLGAASMGLLLIVLGYVFSPFYQPSLGRGPLCGIAEEIPLYFWVFPVSLFSVSGIWFGAWGLIAVFVVAITLFTALQIFNEYLFLFFLLGAVLDAFVPAWAFKRFRIDPGAKTLRSVSAFLVFGIIVITLISTPLEGVVWYAVHAGPVPAMGREEGNPLVTWLVVSMILKMIIGFPLILLCSKFVIKARAYCKGWFS